MVARLAGLELASLILESAVKNRIGYRLGDIELFQAGMIRPRIRCLDPEIM